MIKATMLLYRAPHLSIAEFHDYWRNAHAGLAKKHQDALRIRRYVQVYPSNNDIGAQVSAGRGCIAGDFDGITEAWWDSVEDMLAVGNTSTEIAAAVMQDEKRFVDMSRSILWFGEEREVIPDETKKAKMK